MKESCVLCGNTENIDHHHISYVPEVKIPLCRHCHRLEHRKVFIRGKRASITISRYGQIHLFSSLREAIKITEGSQFDYVAVGRTILFIERNLKGEELMNSLSQIENVLKEELKRENLAVLEVKS